MPENKAKVGETIRKVRMEKGLTLEDVSSKLDISIERLEQIETQEQFPHLGLIVSLAETFGVSVGEIFGDSGNSPFCLVRRDAATAVSRFAAANGKSPGYSYEGLGLDKENRQMEPFLVTLVPEEVQEIDPNEHIGEEFIFVLEGQVRVTLDDHTDILNPGDSIYYDSTLPHVVACAGEQPATILAVIYAKDEMIIL